jgi:hypothetical protein
MDSFLLNPAGFPIERDELAADYWTQKRPKIACSATAYLAPDDFPANLKQVEDGWDAEKVAIDAATAERTITDLLGEAWALRQWTIPPRAYVELRVGPFIGVEVTEVASEVYFVWRTASHHYCLTSVSPEDQRFDDDWPMAGPEVRGRSIELAVRLLVAAMVRDFWVTEERQKVFEIATRRRMGSSLREGKSTNRVVYLPRIRYASSGLTFDRLAEGLHYSVRARHYVRPFFRKVGTPSPLQLEIARRDHVTVPAGSTYVRGHYRGGGAAGSVVYRSRSAMNLLYETIEAPVTATSDRPLSDDWFEFERAVAFLLENHLGFSIIHRAPRGKGDNGVDILATKIANDKSELWIVQCKCYSERNPVGPAIVREVLGAIADAIREENQVVRGMIVTTGRFTGDALRLAAKHGIQTTDGDDLSAICGSINRRSIAGRMH